MIDSGELGDMIQIEGNFSANMAGYAGEWRESRAESPAGGMTSLGIHAIDMLRQSVRPGEERAGGQPPGHHAL